MYPMIGTAKQTEFLLLPMRWAIAAALLLLTSMNLQAQEGVVLLHGLCRTTASMKRMERSLMEAGYVVANVAYPSRTASVEQLANAAIGAALERPDIKACTKVHFVSHSLGGILIRSYFARHAEPRLGRVVMLAPPNQGSEVTDKIGTWWLYRKLNGPAGAELGTSSDSAPRRLGPVAFELGVIAGDRTINWINSVVMIKGPDDGKVSVARTKVDGMKEHLTLHVSHPFIMKNRKVIRHTVSFLKTGAFEGTSKH